MKKSNKSLILLGFTLPVILTASYAFIQSGNNLLLKGVNATNNEQDRSITFTGSTLVTKDSSVATYSLSYTNNGNPIYCVSYNNYGDITESHLGHLRKMDNSYIYFGTAAVTDPEVEVPWFSFRNLKSVVVKSTSTKWISVTTFSKEQESTTIKAASTSSGYTFDISSYQVNNIKICAENTTDVYITSITLNYFC